MFSFFLPQVCNFFRAHGASPAGTFTPSSHHIHVTPPAHSHPPQDMERHDYSFLTPRQDPTTPRSDKLSMGEQCARDKREKLLRPYKTICEKLRNEVRNSVEKYVVLGREGDITLSVTDCTVEAVLRKVLVYPVDEVDDGGAAGRRAARRLGFGRQTASELADFEHINTGFSGKIFFAAGITAAASDAFMLESALLCYTALINIPEMKVGLGVDVLVVLCCGTVLVVWWMESDLLKSFPHFG